MYHWPSRQTLVISTETPQRVTPPTRPSTTPPSRSFTTPPPRPARRIPSFGAAVIHTTPPPRSPAQLREALDVSSIGPMRMPSYVGSLLDAFTIDNIGETSLELDRSFEVSPQTASLPLRENLSTTTISEETQSRMSSPEPGAVPAVQFEGLQLTLSLPERPFSMGSMPEFPTRTPSPPPSRPNTPAPRRRIRLDSSAFEKPPQSFASVSPPARLRRRSCILDCVRKGVKRVAKKDN